jgi:preprotein translocase subunit Sec63
MNSQQPKSIIQLLWEAVRMGARTFWQSPVNPARPYMQRQQALAVLGLPPNATPDQIKRRYRKLAKRYHPDCGGDPKQMQRIIAAYETLTRDPVRN